MTTLDRYRKCFEACGVKLPDKFRWTPGGGVESLSGMWTHVDPISALCVCRCAAIDAGVAAERERCAKIVETWNRHRFVQTEIAAAIRRGEQE